MYFVCVIFCKQLKKYIILLELLWFLCHTCIFKLANGEIPHLMPRNCFFHGAFTSSHPHLLNCHYAGRPTVRICHEHDISKKTRTIITSTKMNYSNGISISSEMYSYFYTFVTLCLVLINKLYSILDKKLLNNVNEFVTITEHKEGQNK